MTTFDSFPGTVLLTDPEGVVVYVNKTIEKRHGFQTAQVIGKKAGALWGRQMPTSFYGELWDTVATKKRPFTSSIKNKKRAGTLQEENVHIAPIIDQSEHITYFLELHPSVENEELARFEDEFIHLWSSAYRQKAEIVFPWIARWVGHSSSEDHITDLNGDTAKAFSDFFVAPTQQTLSERQGDKILIEAAQQDPREFRVVYEKYQKKIYDYFFHRINNDADTANDLAQETFMRAFRALSAFRTTNAHYGTYLMRIAHNLLMNQYRTYRPIMYDTSVLGRIGCEPTYEQDVLGMLKKDLWQAVEGLTNIEKQVMKMKYEEDMRVGEIASILNKSENAIKLCLTRARQKIRRQLGTLPDAA
ncbi:MAG: hypothetical protein A3J66_00175 [Candidatus Magasanikbacteria bacterium RIFCSPHIGHO2_02_FULL_47_14]|uniref:PAS domain-containing protein n=1 Tax=Candidatus Magasanikbacteria bacterium RIFCSPHIGHO2_02_FULL_47_14 TaxID=1798680 RepID=A0A1F6LZC8_9BACT|nr:MAG: hypothetical protein A3J66_00175 [Candidatus Magasanikbacteria bacterium RIFCSPHIGHO2_02_FULL_47_14]